MLTINGKPVDYVDECDFCKKPLWEKTFFGTKLMEATIGEDGCYHNDCKEKFDKLKPTV